MFKLKLINKPKMIKLKCGFSFPNIVLANLQEKEVIPTKEVQEIVADKTYDGLSKVTVQSIPNEYIVPSGEIEFTQNGTYDVTDKASAKVNIKEKVLGTKTITSNGTYKAIDDNLDGYSEVEVATSGVDINEYLSDTITKGTSSLGGWANTILKLRSPLTIEGTDAQYMFYGYPLNEIPQLDTSNVTNMNSMFGNCTNLPTIPQLDTSKVYTMSDMFGGCTNLTTIPQLDTNKVTNMSNMFYYCMNLATVPQLNTSNVTDISYMFYKCSDLPEIPQLDTSNVTDIRYAMNSCSKLTTIPLLNFSNVSNISQLFVNSNYVTNLGGFKNLGQAYLTNQTSNYSRYTLDLSYKPLTKQSIMNVINNLYDIKTKGVKPQQLILGRGNLAKLSEEELAIAQNKGWSVSVTFIK